MTKNNGEFPKDNRMARADPGTIIAYRFGRSRPEKSVIMKKFGTILSLLMLPLIAEIIYSAVKSYLFKDMPIWAFETTIFIYGTLFMLGGACCHLEKKHVAVDVLLNYVSPRTKRKLTFFSEAVVLFVALVTLKVSIPVAYRSTLILEHSTHQTPFNLQIWWFKWIIPVSCALLAWQAGFDIYNNVTRPEKTGV